MERLLKAIQTLDSPKEFIVHVGKDLIINRKDIYGDVKTMISTYHNNQFFEFGKAIGNCLDKLLVA